MKNHHPIFIVEGNIGSGKSTFLTIVEKELKAKVIYEPVDKWQNISGENLLEKFYSDTPRWAYTFQTYAFVTRALSQVKCQSQTNRLQILERSVFSDRYCFAKNCFEIGKMSSMEWELYKDWFEWLTLNCLTLPDAFIYLKADPQTCLDRLKMRSRSEEVCVSIEYLESLHQKHEKWLIEKSKIAPYLQKIPVLELDCNKDFEHDLAHQNKLLSKIINFSKNLKIPENILQSNYSTQQQNL